MIQGDILCPCSIYRGIIMPLYHIQGHNFYPPVAYTKMEKDFKTTNSHPPTHSSSLISTISEENVQKRIFVILRQRWPIICGKEVRVSYLYLQYKRYHKENPKNFPVINAPRTSSSRTGWKFTKRVAIPMLT